MKSIDVGLLTVLLSCYAAPTTASGDNASQLSVSQQAKPRKESHPILLIRPDQVEQYKVRIADMPESMKTYGMSTDIPLVALIDYLRGRHARKRSN